MAPASAIWRHKWWLIDKLHSAPAAEARPSSMFALANIATSGGMAPASAISVWNLALICSTPWERVNPHTKRQHRLKTIGPQIANMTNNYRPHDDKSHSDVDPPQQHVHRPQTGNDLIICLRVCSSAHVFVVSGTARRQR